MCLITGAVFFFFDKKLQVKINWVFSSYSLIYLYPTATNRRKRKFIHFHFSF